MKYYVLLLIGTGPRKLASVLFKLLRCENRLEATQ